MLEELSGRTRKALYTDYYNEEQRVAVAKAVVDDNNRANRGLDHR